MGCGMSTEEKEGKARNEEIENQLKRDKMMQRNEIKMLLLGKRDPGSTKRANDARFGPLCPCPLPHCGDIVLTTSCYIQVLVNPESRRS